MKRRTLSKSAFYVYKKCSDIWINLSLVGQQVGTDSTLKRGWCTHWKEHKQALSKHGGTCLCGTLVNGSKLGHAAHIWTYSKEAKVRKGSLQIHRKSALNGNNVISYKAHDLAWWLTLQNSLYEKWHLQFWQWQFLFLRMNVQADAVHHVPIHWLLIVLQMRILMSQCLWVKEQPNCVKCMCVCVLNRESRWNICLAEGECQSS